MERNLTGTFAAPILCVLLLTGCNDNPLQVDVDGISANLEVARFEKLFYNNDSAEFYTLLPEMKEQFPVFFTEGNDLIYIDRRFDEQLQRLWSDVNKVYTPQQWADNTAELEEGFRHLRYYYPHWPEMSGVSYISNLDFGMPILFIDSLRSIYMALDVYLGADHPAYAQLPAYIARRNTPDYLACDVFEAIGQSMARENPEDFTLLNAMIHMGKIRYFQQAMQPEKPLEFLFGYSAKELEFCKKNERNIWMYFIEEQLLFDTRMNTRRRFLGESPFTKFYMAFDNQTPGRIGEWVGWRIVSEYMRQNSEVTLPELMEKTHARDIFTDSQYRP